MKNLIWYNNIDVDTFFPSCFDLAVNEDLDDFVEEFKAIKAESYVKIFVREMRETEGEREQIPAGQPGNSVTNKVLKIALRVCERRLKDLDDLIDDPKAFTELCSEKEWAILAADELDKEALQKKKHQEWIQKNEVKTQAQGIVKKKSKKKKKKKVKRKKSTLMTEQTEEEKKEEGIYEEGESGSETEESETEEEEDPEEYLAKKHPEYKRAVKVLDGLKIKFPQFNLNGEKNIWIIKPASMSRGRGIILFKNLIEILDHVGNKET